VVVGSTLHLLKLLLEYLQFVDTLPALAPDLLRKLIELLQVLPLSL
jgi:hypothetical protein